jgi:hypothetical protein
MMRLLLKCILLTKSSVEFGSRSDVGSRDFTLPRQTQDKLRRCHLNLFVWNTCTVLQRCSTWQSAMHLSNNGTFLLLFGFKTQKTTQNRVVEVGEV